MSTSVAALNLKPFFAPASVALVHGNGGVISIHCTLILGDAATGPLLGGGTRASSSHAASP